MWCAVVHVPDSAVLPDPSTPPRMLLGWGSTFPAAQSPAPGAGSPLQQPFGLWALSPALHSSRCLCHQTWGKHKHRDSVGHFLNEEMKQRQGLSTISNTLVWRWRQNAEPGSLPPPSTHLQTAINRTEMFGYKVTGSIIRKLLPGCFPSPPPPLKTNFHLWSIHYPWLSSHCYCQSKRRLYLPSATLNY